MESGFNKAFRSFSVSCWCFWFFEVSFPYKQTGSPKSNFFAIPGLLLLGVDGHISHIKIIKLRNETPNSFNHIVIHPFLSKFRFPSRGIGST